MLDPKCIYRKSIFAKCTRLACLLSFARKLTIFLKILKIIKMVPADYYQSISYVSPYFGRSLILEGLAWSDAAIPSKLTNLHGFHFVWMNERMNESSSSCLKVIIFKYCFNTHCALSAHWLVSTSIPYFFRANCS